MNLYEKWQQKRLERDIAELKSESAMTSRVENLFVSDDPEFDDSQGDLLPPFWFAMSILVIGMVCLGAAAHQVYLKFGV